MPDAAHIHQMARLVQRIAVLAALLAVASPVGPTAARADDRVPVRAETPSAPRPRVEWSPRWPRFRGWEYAATVAFGVGTVVVYRYAPPPAEPKWQGDNAFDDAFRSWLRADTRAERERAGAVSDVLWKGGMYFPFAVDVPVILLAHRQPGVAWQVLMMDVQATAVAQVINGALFYEVGRARPLYRDCLADPNYDKLCGGDDNAASFPSGHVLGIATGAGLTCAHHRYLPIYGNPAADAGVCALMSAATVATAATRIMADRHNASDAIAGAAIGFGVGYGLPWLLHYRGGAAGDERADAAPRPMVVPFANAGALGLGLFSAL